MTATLTEVGASIDLRLRGHWADDDRCHYGCGHPTPADAPAAHMTDAQVAEYADLTEQFAGRTLPADRYADLLALHRIAYPGMERP